MIYVGDGQIVHAISENVSYIDAIDFLRCDAFVILRPKNQSIVDYAIARAEQLVGKPYDFDFADHNDNYYCHELAVECYSMLHFEKKQAKILGFNCGTRYLSTTFTESDQFEKVLEFKC